MNIETNNELARIVKSDNVTNSFDQLNFINVDPNSPEEIIRATYQPVNNNSYTTVLPLQPEAEARKQEYVQFNTAVQPILIEFDSCEITIQKERAIALARHINTPIYTVYSGNRSIHTYVWFNNFSSNPMEYKKGCEHFVNYLSSSMPDYFQSKNGSDSSLVPDFAMFDAARYCRQAGGTNTETGKEQTFEELISIENCPPMNLSELNGKVKISNTVQPNIPIPRIGKTALSRATLHFVAIGSEEGSRDDNCFKAAYDLHNCGYSKEEAFYPRPSGILPYPLE